MLLTRKKINNHYLLFCDSHTKVYLECMLNQTTTLIVEGEQDYVWYKIYVSTLEGKEN